MVVAEARVSYRAPLQGETVAEGKLRHAFIETGGGAKQPIPESIRAQLSLYAAA